jgi:hypothetical protein
MICPLEFLQTAAWVEKSSLMAMSKFTLKYSEGGGDHSSLTGEDLEVHAAKCFKETRLMLAASLDFRKNSLMDNLVFGKPHQITKNNSINLKQVRICKVIPKELWGG